MDIRNMRQLLAIRAHGSFAKAAVSLDVSQQSLSAAMSRLEINLGVKLFHRSSGGSALTAIGELIAQRVSTVLAETEAIVRDAELIASGQMGVLRLGVGTSLRPHFLPELLRAIVARSPDLRLQVQVLDRDKLVPLLKSRDLDLIICAVGEESAEDGLIVTPIMATRVIVAARPNHPLADDGRLHLARFEEFAAGGASIAGYTNAELMAVRDPQSAVSKYVANDYETLLILARAGACTVVAPYYVLQPEIAAGSLVQLDLDWGLSVAFAAITTRASNYSPIVKRAVETATEIGRQIGHTAAWGAVKRPNS